MRRKILAITGIRSEYDISYPLLKVLRDSKRFEIKLVVSNAHLSDWHGFTLSKIEEDGFEIAEKIDCLLMTNRKTQRVKGVGILTYALSQTVDREKPDLLFVVGDREESIAAALVGNYMNILVAHLGGGDPVYGNADDPIRFAVSKLAHIHLTTAKPYSENLINIGEEKFRIFNVGNPALDNIKNTVTIPLKEIGNQIEFAINDKKYVVLIKHPLSSEKEDSYAQMEITLRALKKFHDETGYKVIASYPNTDPGSYDILDAIKLYEKESFIKFYKSLPRELFVNIMRNSKALIGNSSMGILEAPFYKLPVINVGNRQKGRLNAGNVVFVKHDVIEIKKALLKACFDNDYRDRVKKLENPFGDGNSSQKILKVFNTINISDKKWYIKKRLC